MTETNISVNNEIVFTPTPKKTWCITFADGTHTFATAEAFRVEPSTVMFYFYNKVPGTQRDETIALFALNQVRSIQRSLV